MARTRVFIRNAYIVSGSILLCLFLVILMLGPAIAPYHPNDQDLMRTLEKPSRDYILGTDALGRDVLSRIIHGTRYSFFIALASVTLSTIIGTVLGLTAGFFKGNVDDVIMRMVDIILSIPELLTAIVIVSIMGPGVAGLIIAISLAFIPRLARLTRGTVLQTMERDYIEAGRAIGLGNTRLMFRHVLPNAAAPILVEVSIRMGQAILITAALGFIGLGVRPPTPEWGTIMSEGKDYLTIAPHVVVATGFFISLSVLCFNLLGDGLRDVLDPRLTGS